MLAATAAASGANSSTTTHGATATSANSKTSPAVVKGWILQQKNAQLGLVTTRMSNSATKFSTSFFAVIMLPPDYHILFYNDRTKKYIQLTKEEWKHKSKVLYAHNMRPERPGKWTKKEKITIAGMKATHYQREAVGDPGLGYYKEIEDRYTTSEVKVPKALYECLPFLRKNEDSMGLPLRITHTYFRGARPPVRTQSLDTVSCKPATIAMSDYELPKNFKKVASEMDVLSEMSEDDILGMQDDLDGQKQDHQKLDHKNLDKLKDALKRSNSP